jgi:tetratricopeptide (TPR) repeat protein
MADSADASTSSSLPSRIAQRYRVIKALGHGGMARVYHVADEVSGAELALKQLSLPERPDKRAAVAALFEAEYHTLAQLSHPRVIEVYDYGLAEAGPFYTMELLDGGDLSDRSPLPWREACALCYDVCSSLALLHSRRFVHRDISPRNIRCTHDGRAKLIDFGTMMPIGQSAIAAGTPAFVAPEVVNRSALDGRADLFSLGATLYHALTRRAPFPAREFGELAELWKRRPRPPSSFVPEIPPALDGLVLGLLSLDPATRPRNAFEVMQRLSAIAGLDREEALVSQAYLSMPILVARESELATVASRIEQAKARQGSACLLRAQSGLGRSRMLDACVLEAKAQGAIVLRAVAGAGSSERFALARTLVEQLLEAPGQIAVESAREEGLLETLFESIPGGALQHPMPDVREQPQLKRLAEVAGGEDAALDALTRWLLRASKSHLVVIAVDDLHRCDMPSASLLAALGAQVDGQSLFMALTIEAGAPENAPEAIGVLGRYCSELGLEALTRAQTEQLLSSVFGNVPNLGVLTEAVHEIARGNPRKCLDVVQHLVDRDALRYAGGSWTLPEQIDPAVLPRSAEAAMQERIAALDPLARWLAQAHALCLFDSLSHEDFAALRPDADRQAIDRALMQLLGQQVLASDGSHYALARRSWAALLTAELDAEERAQRHRALAKLYESSAPVASVHHLLASGQRELALSRVLAFVDTVGHDAFTLWERSSRMRPADLVGLFERAHHAAIELNRPARDRIVTLGWTVGLSVMADDAYYYRFSPAWRAQLEHDSGLTIYRGLSDIGNPNDRLMRALQLLAERYAATPEHERAYSPEEAIRLVVLYVGVSIAVGSRCYDRSLLMSLPDLLQPFCALSPVIEAVRLNALASLDVSCDCRLEQGLARWKDVYARLMQVDAVQLPAVTAFRGAVAYAIGLVEARLGLDSANEWVELLDHDPTQRVNALYLRKVTCLHQGDVEGAERWRKQAEIVALQTPMRQMFTNVVVAELWAHAASDDLVGVKETLERIVPLSERYPGWVPVRLLAEAQFQTIRGDAAAATELFERCLALCTPDPSDPERSTMAWPSAVGSYVDALQRLGRYEQARQVAQDALALGQELEIGASAHEIARGLALAEARLGDYASAWTRLERVIEEQCALRVKGLQLGASYEACTRVAIWAGDIGRLQLYAALTASEYRHGRGSPLGARYERLMEEASHAGLQAPPELTDFASTGWAATRAESRSHATSSLLETAIGETDPSQRPLRALQALCRARGARGGHLYLCTERGIALAASEGIGEPPDGLAAFLEHYMRVEDDLSEGETSIATEAELESKMRATTWGDASGTVHRPLVLVAAVDGVARQIGVASFVIDDEQAQQALPAQLSAAIAAYLIDAGSVSVVAAGRA